MKFDKKVEWAIERADLTPQLDQEFRRVLAMQKKTFHLSQPQVNSLAEKLIALRWLPPVFQAGQHPIVQQFVTKAHMQGGMTYSEKYYAVALFEDGRQVEIRVDPPKPKKERKTKD